MLVDQDNLRRKNEELAQAFRDKSRKHSQTQELYDKLKRRVMLGQVQNAASDAVDHTIHASVANNRSMDPTTGFDQRPQQPILFT
jgi:E3 ubiquitin-protein ligase CCNP1IP1